MLNMATYISSLQKILETIKTQQVDSIKQSGAMVASTLIEGGIVHVFGSGHSHMIAEEAFFRAGGLVPVNPILDQRLLFLKGALESTYAEREMGYAANILQQETLISKDVAIIVSNSGRNAVPVEMALELRLKGLKLIAITNVDQSRQSSSRHISGTRLFELVDVIIDNCIPPGDSVLQLATGQTIGPSSTVAGAAIINSIMIEAASVLLQKNLPVPVFPSANIDTSDSRQLEDILKEYSPRIKYFNEYTKSGDH